MFNHSVQWQWFHCATYCWYSSRAGVEVPQVGFLSFIILFACLDSYFFINVFPSFWSLIKNSQCVCVRACTNWKVGLFHEVSLHGHERNILLARFAGKETLRCLALALKWMPSVQQALSFDDEKDLTFIGLVCFLFNV